MKTDDRECTPPEGTDDFTLHVLSREVGDGSRRQEFEAHWTGGMWETRGIHWLSPRKAAYATWTYVRPVPERDANDAVDLSAGAMRVGGAAS